MIDGGVIAGYVAAAAARGGKRLFDAAADAALDRLTGAVVARVGAQRAAALERDPQDPRAQQEVAGAVTSAARGDPAFARELEALRRQLERAGVEPLVNTVHDVHTNIQAFHQGRVHVGNRYEHHSNHDYHPGDELVSGEGPGRVLAVLGTVIALSGFAAWMWLIFTATADVSPFERELLPGVPLGIAAFGAFVLGGVLSGIGSTMSKAARHRRERAQRW